MAHFDASFLAAADMALLRGVLGIPVRPPVVMPMPVSEQVTARRLRRLTRERKPVVRTAAAQRGAA